MSSMDTLEDIQEDMESIKTEEEVKLLMGPAQ